MPSQSIKRKFLYKDVLATENQKARDRQRGKQARIANYCNEATLDGKTEQLCQFSEIRKTSTTAVAETQNKTCKEEEKYGKAELW